MTTFRELAPAHPYLRRLETAFQGLTILDPHELASAALQARASRTPPPLAFTEGLDALRAEGAPHDVYVAAHLDAVARGDALPPIPDALPEPVRAFLAQLHDAARELLSP